MISVLSSLRFLPTLLTAAVLAGAAAVTFAGTQDAPGTPARRPLSSVPLPVASAPDAAPQGTHRLFVVDSAIQAESVLREYGDARLRSQLDAHGMPAVIEHVLQMEAATMTVLVIPPGKYEDSGAALAATIAGEVLHAGMLIEVFDLRR